MHTNRPRVFNPTNLIQGLTAATHTAAEGSRQREILLTELTVLKLFQKRNMCVKDIVLPESEILPLLIKELISF